VSDDDLRKITDVRRLLEPPSMRALAAVYPQLTDRHEPFRDLAARTLVAATSGELSDYIVLDYEFHTGLLDCLDNQRLSDIVSDLRNQTRLVGLAKLRDSDTLVTTTREHDTLLDLLEAGDADSAEALMHRHIGHILGHWSGRPEAPRA
jgi:DNA-binding GntR family transcriptional regulator